MIDHPEFMTRTMAKIYADQGHFRKAAEIYRKLLEKEPDSRDLAKALSVIETSLCEEDRADKKDLVPLLKEWVQLSLKYNNIRRLKRFGKS